MRILIVDDDIGNRRLLRHIINDKGHETIEAEDGLDGLRMATIHAPDLIISDALMPIMDGFQFLRAVRKDEKLKTVPFIFYSAVYNEHKDVEFATALGAGGYIIKPKSPADFWDEVETILEEQTQGKVAAPELISDEEEYMKRYSGVVSSKLKLKVTELEKEIDERKKAEEEIEQLLINTITSLASALDAKSHWTTGHSERVTQIALEIGKAMELKEEELERLRLAGLLHDIGKIGTSDMLLDKPAKLTSEEFDMVKKHPGKGAEILAPIKQLRDIVPVILYHHERYDGKGYPEGLMGEKIPIHSRILCVADSFDSMTADRPYRPAPGIEYAISEFKRCEKTQFDPQVVDAFLKVIER